MDNYKMSSLLENILFSQFESEKALFSPTDITNSKNTFTNIFSQQIPNMEVRVKNRTCIKLGISII